MTVNLAFYGSQDGKQKRIQTHGTKEESMKVACDFILGNDFCVNEVAWKVLGLNDDFFYEESERLGSGKDIFNVIVGNWDKHIVQVDFDKMPLPEVKYWCYRACNFFRLKGFIVLESSKREFIAKEMGKNGKVTYRYVKRNYLAVFDRPVSWAKNCHIINWIALESGSEDLKKWVTMQCIKESSTLRLSPKIDKPIPKVVFCYGSQDRQIKRFLETRELVLDILKQIKKESVVSIKKALGKVK